MMDGSEEKGVGITPLFSRLIVEEAVLKQVGSIIIPQNSREMRLTEGTVVAVGDEVESVKVGDEVYYGQYVGFPLKRGGKEYRCMNEEDLIGLINRKRED